MIHSVVLLCGCILTSIFMRNVGRQKNPLEPMLADQENLKNLNS